MSFFPVFRSCPICHENRFVTIPATLYTTARIEKCDYCYEGKVALYYPKRSRLSKLICCHEKFNEPDDAKSRLLNQAMLNENIFDYKKWSQSIE